MEVVEAIFEGDREPSKTNQPRVDTNWANDSKNKAGKYASTSEFKNSCAENSKTIYAEGKTISKTEAPLWMIHISGKSSKQCRVIQEHGAK